MENISFFTDGSKQLGLKDTQVFTGKELHEKGKIINVIISLYWLGRAARCISGYKGPHLNLNAFHQGMHKLKCSQCKLPITDDNYLATMDQQFHKHCVACIQCKKQLDPKELFYQNGEDFYCSCCMITTTNMNEEKTARLDENCAMCHKSLKGLNHDHKKEKLCSNWVCCHCMKQFGDDIFFEKEDGKRICPSCLEMLTRPL